MNAPFKDNKHAWLDEVARLELTGRELRIIIAIKSLYREDASTAAVSVADLMSRTGLPRRTVQRQLDAIEAHRLVEVDRSRGGPRKHSVRLLDPAFATIKRAASERENCATQGGAVLPPSNEAPQVGNCATLHGAVTAPLHACARISPLTLAAGPALQAGPDGAPSSAIVESTSDAKERNSEFRDAAPDAPWRGAGAHGKGDPSSVVPASMSLAERIVALDDAISGLRDPETGLFPKMPPSVCVFENRHFYPDEDLPEIEAEGPVAEAESDLRRLLAGECVFEDEDEDQALSQDERILALHRAIESAIRDRVPMPEMFADFVDRAVDPEADELDDLEASWFEFAEAAEAKARRRDQEEPALPLEVRGGLTEREEVERLIAARSRAQKAMEPPLAVRIQDAARRASYVERLSVYLRALDRKTRCLEARAHKARIFAGLAETLPRFRASALSEELFDDVLTEVWRLERDELGAVVSSPKGTIARQETAHV